PAALPMLRAGDLVSRFVADVDAALDVLVRVVVPYLVAILVGAAAVGLIGAVLPPAGAALALGLLLVAVGVPLIQHAVARRADQRSAPLRPRNGRPPGPRSAGCSPCSNSPTRYPSRSTRRRCPRRPTAWTSPVSRRAGRRAARTCSKTSPSRWSPARGSLWSGRAARARAHWPPYSSASSSPVPGG